MGDRLAVGIDWQFFALESALAMAHARCKLWVYLGTLPVIIATIQRPPRKNKHYPEASGIFWHP